MANSTRKRKAKRQKHGHEAEQPVLETEMSNKKTREEILADEAEDLATLREFADHATVVQFDDRNGQLVAPKLDEISGLLKVTLPFKLLQSFTDVHEEIKTQVGMRRMVPWAGVGGDSTRLRSFGFVNQERRTRLNDSGIRLYALEKDCLDEDEILEDERANNRACIVLSDEWKEKAESAAQSLVNLLPPMTPTLTVQDLIALQPNLHNGATHLAAHVDFPRHEGFGKVICTVAVRGAATILLIERDCNDESGCPRAWKFRLNDGDCYVLSGNARTRVLHAVLADDNANGNRESLNLRFGLHTAEEAETEVMKYWEDSF